MLVASYNNKAFNDVLSIQLRESYAINQTFERKEDIAEIKNKESGDVVGYNFFNASQWLEFESEGPVTLSKAQVDVLNDALEKAGFEGKLEADTAPKFVVGYVKECEPMEDSDHLSITQTEVDNGEVLQIVCGAPNIAQGQKVVVAKPGAVMPDGLVIWPGELRGETSNGMITSARELGLDNSKTGHQGIMVLDEDAAVGSEYTF
jgi:tRNA-binding protein